ncbi:MAG: hypothetical protein WCD28_05555 [Nitrososphaeraceae archaeon]
MKESGVVMISNFYQNNRFTTLFVLAVASGLVISLLLSLLPTNAIQSVNQSPQSTIPPAKLTYTSLGGDLKGSIEGLLSDLTDIAGSTSGQISGKIASSDVNVNNGTVEKVLLGNWSLDSEQGNSPVLLVDFDVLSNTKGIPQKQSSTENFVISNLTVNSMQQNDGNMEIGGTVTVSQKLGNQQQQVWNDVGARLSIANKVLVLTLDGTSEPGQIFAQSPIVGFVTQST